MNSGERPLPAMGGIIEWGRRDGFRGNAFARIGRAAGNPRFEIGDDRRRKPFLFGRHLEVVVLVANGLEQQAFGWLPRNDGRAGIAAGEQGFAGVEEKPALGFPHFSGVAFVAILDKDRADALFEEGKVLSPAERDG